jgi:squalene-hopene/tetraprenyl-beta-curcumene cyclase
VRAGAEFLVGTQHASGGWTETPFTGTGFPRVFYLKYHMYPVYFPLMALARYSSAVRRPETGSRTEYRLDAGHPAPSPHGVALKTPAEN